MTNREAYKDEIIKFSLDGYSWGVNKDTGEPICKYFWKYERHNLLEVYDGRIV